eukprot:7326548-Pyramimonas_sp.AAC.1
MGCWRFRGPRQVDNNITMVSSWCAFTFRRVFAQCPPFYLRRKQQTTQRHALLMRDATILAALGSDTLRY